MSRKSDYDAGYRAGRNGFAKHAESSEYTRGYWQGKQEYDYWNDKDLYPGLRHGGCAKQVSKSNDAPTKEGSILLTAIGGSVILTLFGWGFVGVILLLLWIGGESGSFWFQMIWRVAFWAGIGFVAIMSIVGMILAVIEQQEKRSKS